MTRHIGIVACSAEGAALCYRTICTEAEALMGEHRHPETSLHGFPFAAYNECLFRGDWAGVADLMARSAEKLARLGADFAICPDNTIHEAFDAAVAASPIPWLHIADAVADAATTKGYRRVGITGTKYLVSGPVYPTALERAGIAWLRPDEAARERMNDIIFGELVKGVFTDEARGVFNGIFAELGSAGCDAIVMGCTEIPILMDGVATPLPTLDSTRLLARAAIRHALA